MWVDYLVVFSLFLGPPAAGTTSLLASLGTVRVRLVSTVSHNNLE